MTARDGATSPIRDVDPADVDDARRNGVDPRAVKAAASALSVHLGDPGDWYDIAAVAVAAAAPILRAAERQRVLSAITAAANFEPGCNEDIAYYDGLMHAARIAEVGT